MSYNKVGMNLCIRGHNLLPKKGRTRCLECQKLHSAKWSKHNPTYFKTYNRNRRQKDLNFRLAGDLRSRLAVAVSLNLKSGSAVEDLGCSIGQLKLYLESKFYINESDGRWMSWDCWESNGWHIDHIKPLSSFDLTDRSQFLQACHYTNLQPLWAKDNLKKGAK